MNTRVSQASDPIIIDLGLMGALDQYVQADNEDISCFIAKFLNTFVTDSSLLEPYEVDNFILRNGRVLSAWWVILKISIANAKFTVLPVHGISTIFTVMSSLEYGFRFSFVF